VFRSALALVIATLALTGCLPASHDPRTALDPVVHWDGEPTAPAVEVPAPDAGPAPCAADDVTTVTLADGSEVDVNLTSGEALCGPAVEVVFFNIEGDHIEAKCRTHGNDGTAIDRSWFIDVTTEGATGSLVVATLPARPAMDPEVLKAVTGLWCIPESNARVVLDSSGALYIWPTGEEGEEPTYGTWELLELKPTPKVRITITVEGEPQSGEATFTDDVATRCGPEVQGGAL
jgi:hypothetical protein